MSKLYATLILGFGIFSISFAQLPATNLYYFKMNQVTDSLFIFSQPKFLTAFNQQGYNNQPKFINNEEIYFTVKSPETGDQTDIYSLNFSTHTKTRITATTESEYSPSPIPNSQEFSCVRVESDANQTQRLWRFPMDRSNSGRPVLYNVKDVGYHFWLDQNTLALFIVGRPHYLSIAYLDTKSTSLIMSNIGRCFQQLPNGNLAFVHKISDNFWQIRELDVRSKKTTTIITTLRGSEDFVILPDGTFLMGKGSKLYKFNKAIDSKWLEIADFKYYHIDNISRLTVSGDNKLVFVAR